MADIELVIKIPEEDWKFLKESDGCRWSRQIIESVINGIPLPKGHGNLKDADKLKYAFVTWSSAVQGNFSDADIASIIYNSPTIIEADKED